MAQQNDLEMRNNDTPASRLSLHSSMLIWLEEDPMEFLENLDNVFRTLDELLMERQLCPCDVLEMLRLVSKAIIDEFAADDEVAMAREMTHLGLLTLELLARVCMNYRLSLDGVWERMAFAAVSFVHQWLPGLFRPEFYRKMPPIIKHWLANVMYHEHLCPKPLLRLELLRFVVMWEPLDFHDPYLGSYVPFGFLVNAVHLSVSRLLPVGRAGLLCVLRRLLETLQTAELLGHLTRRSCSAMVNLQVRQTERVFAYLVVLMGKAAQRLRRMRCKKIKSSRKTIEGFRDVLRILRLLTAVPPNQRLYEMPGMCQLAGGAVATTVRSIVLTSFDPATKDHFRKLLYDVDEYFLTLCTNQSPGTLVNDLRRHHGRDLTFFSKSMRHHGCLPVHVPQPLKKLDVREKFMDSVTKRLMMSPVRLEATGSVVDYSTLVRLLLVRETHPFQAHRLQDLSFTPLEDLRKEILAWRVEMTLGCNDAGSSSDSDDEVLVLE